MEARMCRTFACAAFAVLLLVTPQAQTATTLGVQRIRVLDEQVCVEQFVGVFVGMWRGRIGEAEVDSVLVAGDDGVDRRVIPRAETLEAKYVPVIREGRRQVVVKNWGAIWRIIGLNILRGMTVPS
jgi:hypothetical protein